MSDEEASLTWLQKQQRKLEERRSAQRRRELSGGSHFGGGHVGGGGAGGHEANLMRELKTSLDRARSETTDGYAASETASLLFSDTSTRESSPHKPIHMEMNGGGGGHGVDPLEGAPGVGIEARREVVGVRTPFKHVQ